MYAVFFFAVLKGKENQGYWHVHSWYTHVRRHSRTHITKVIRDIALNNFTNCRIDKTILFVCFFKYFLINFSLLTNPVNFTYYYCIFFCCCCKLFFLVILFFFRFQGRVRKRWKTWYFEMFHFYQIISKFSIEREREKATK